MINDNPSLLFLAATDIIKETLVVFDAIVIFICTVSLFLCGRSVYRSLKLAMVRYIFNNPRNKIYIKSVEENNLVINRGYHMGIFVSSRAVSISHDRR